MYWKILCYEYFGVLISSVAKLCYFAKKKNILGKLGKTSFSQKKHCHSWEILKTFEGN
jgi:hypothetical protein